MKRIAGWLVALAVVAALVACDSGGGGDDDDAPTYTISGTAYAPGGYNNAAAHTIYMKLVASGAGGGGAALYSAAAVILAGNTSAAYSMGGIAGGVYEGWTFIDQDDNAVPANPVADSGDYYTTSGAGLAINADMPGTDIPDDAWAVVP